MLVLTDYLKATNAQNEARNEQRANNLKNDLKASINSIAQSQSTQSSQLQLLTSGSLTFRLEVPQQQPQQQQLLLPLPSSRYVSAQASIVATPLACSPTPQLQEEQQQELLELLEPPKYRMCRAVRSVEALWREWTVGLQGKPSIETLDRKWGNRWRAGR